VRKLEHLLGDARERGRRSLLTVGAWGSHHVLATAVHGAAQGFEVHAVVAPQPLTDHVSDDLRAVLATGARVHPARGYAGATARLAAVAASLRRRGRAPYVIGPGGSSPVGTLGMVSAGLELAEQMDRGEVPEPDAIYVATGSGGTVVGAALGLAAGGVTARLVAVRVTDRWMLHRRLLDGLARRTVAHLKSADRRFPDVARAAMDHVAIDHRHAGPGYGRPVGGAPRAHRLARADGLVLDDTYTAKAFASLLDDAAGDRAGERLMFWQTLSSTPLDRWLVEAPPLPAWAAPPRAGER